MIPKSVATDIDFFPADKDSLDNVYHIATDVSKPALISFLEKRQQLEDYFLITDGVITDGPALLDIEQLMYSITTSLSESYKYSSNYLLDLTQEAIKVVIELVARLNLNLEDISEGASFTNVNIGSFTNVNLSNTNLFISYFKTLDTSDTLNSFSLYFSRLNLLLKLILFKVNFDKYVKLLAYISKLIVIPKRGRKDKDPRDIDLEMYLAGGLDIFELIFSNPQPLTLDQLSQLNAFIDNSDITFKDEYKLYADRKGHSTSSEVMVLALLALMSSLGDSYSNMLNYQIDLEEDINLLQGSEDFEAFKKFKNGLVTVEDKKSMVKETYKTNATASLMAQNSPLDKDDLEGKEAKMSLQVVNISNEKNINSGVYISNSYELEQELKIVNSNMEVDINSINDSNSKLISSNILLTDNQSSIGQSNTDNLILQEVDNSKEIASVLKLSTSSLLDNTSKQASINKAIKEHTSSSNALSPMYSSIITKRTNSLSLVSTKSSQINLLGINALSSSNTNIKRLLDVIGVIVLLKVVQDDSRGIIKNALTLLQNPLELVLLNVNAVLCSLKSLQCLIAGVITGLASLGEDLLSLISSVDKLEQLKEIGLIKLESLTDRINSSLTNSQTNDFISKAKELVREKSDEMYSEIQDILDENKANKITNAYIDYMEVKIQTVANDPILLAGLTLNCSTAIDGVLSDIKSSFENTLENAKSLTNIDSCRTIDLDLPSLDFLIEIKNPFQFNLPDFSIPRIDSKSIKCR